ncbi:MAG: MarR family transcriptional regulator, partial [Ramlibacter sp.]
MNTNLGFCLALHCAHASLQLKLDDELGIHHGISFNDFALLNLLADADGGRVSFSELVHPLGQRL